MERGFTIVELIVAVFILAIVGGAGWYVYNSNQEVSRTYSGLEYVSSPVPPDANRVVAVGDIACDPNDSHFSGADPAYCQSHKTYGLLADIKPEAILALGDLQYEDGTFDKFMHSYDHHWGKEKTKTYPAAGNHEYETEKAGGYFSYFGNRAGEPDKGYYSFNIGAWHAIALNSNCDEIGGCGMDSTQYKWLRQDLESNHQACTLAFWHHPHFTSGRYANQQTVLTRTTAFWELLAVRKADIVLAGHDHLYERFAPQNAEGEADSNGMRQFTAGTGGKVLYKKVADKPNSEVLIDNSFGVLTLELYGKAYKWQFISTDNKVLDSGTQSCVI